MAGHPYRTCFLLVLLPFATALRFTGYEARNGTNFANGTNGTGVFAWRAQLSNIQDLQYFGEITIGGQTIQGILDTGSFELVVFDARCRTCGIAGAYNPSRSRTYTKGDLDQVHSYGSGSCETSDAHDTVAIEGLVASDQAMWLATNCMMPILEQAHFNAIVGIGPPGQPVITAEQTLKELQDAAQDIKRSGMNVPQDLQDSITQSKKELKSAQDKPSMLENFGVKTFSECLGKEPGSPGWLVWNDETREGLPGVQRIPVVGNITWGVVVEDIALGASLATACLSGCGSIVDTGTSLFAVPSEMYEAITHSVEDFLRSELPADAPRDCSDLSYFPHLRMKVGGQNLTFPPSSYIGSFFGQASSEASQLIKTRSLERSGCQLLVMDLGPTQLTSIGPMIILGMPFFREYYTTFDLGGGPGNRSLWVSKSSPSCEPPAQGIVSGHAERSAHGYAFKPRRVDASKLRVPDALKRLRGKL